MYVETVSKLIPKPEGWTFDFGQRVRKIRGSEWQGHVCGFYITEINEEGYAVKSEREKNAVQVWPRAALEAVEDVKDKSTAGFAGKWIIVKYYTEGITYYLSDAVSKFTHTFKECGINKSYFDTKEEAEAVLPTLQAFNPVGYGVVLVWAVKEAFDDI